MSRRIICTVTTDLCYDQRMMRIGDTLAQAGYEVLLLGRERPTSPPLTTARYAQRRMRCWFHHGKLFYLEYNLRLFLYLLFARYDGVCAVDLDTLLPAFLCCRLRGKVCVYDAHEYFTEVPEVIDRPAVKRAWEAVADLVIPRLRYAYTVGDGLAKIMGERYGIPFAVIRNLPLPSPAPPPDPVAAKTKIILYQGALNEGRGLEVAIAAMSSIEGAELWLAGDGDLTSTLQQQAQALGLTDRVRFLGYVLPAELARLTPQAYIGLNLLENKGLSYYYSLANKTFDYMRAGIPGIHPDFPEYRHLYEQHQAFVLLPSLTPDALADAIQRLIDDEDYYLTLRRNSLAAAQELNWQKEGQRLVDFYEGIRWSG